MHTFFRFFAIFSAAFALLACEDQSELYQEEMDLCVKHFQARSFKVARQECAIAGKNHLPAQLKMAQLLSQGLGGEVNQPEAFKWYLKAAEQNSSVAQTQVAIAYWYGFGTPIDLAQTERWLKRAASQKNAEALRLLGHLYFEGEAVARDINRTVSFFEQSVQQGSWLAVNDLAWTLATYPDEGIRNGARAVQLMEPLIARRRASATLVDTLAAAYAETGDWNGAQLTQQKAIERAFEDQMSEETVQEMTLRLENYFQKKPWRQPL